MISSIRGATAIVSHGENFESEPRSPVSGLALPLDAAHAGSGGDRPSSLQAGQDPRLVLHRPRERGRIGRRGSSDGPRRRRGATASQLGCSHHPRNGTLANPRELPRPCRRAFTRTRRQRALRRTGARPDHDRQSPAGDASRRRRLRARLPDPRRTPRGGGLVRRRSLSTRGLPRSDEPRSRASLAGRVHLRQQPVGLRHQRTSNTPPSSWPTERAHTDSRASPSTAPMSSPSTARPEERSRKPAPATDQP